MKNNINKRIQVSIRKGEIWNIKVGYFHPTLLLKKDVPTDVIYLKFKLVLN